MKRKVGFVALLASFALVTSFATAATPASTQVGLSKDLIYFVMPDRYKDGNKTNDKLEGYDPTDTAFYHGGDLKGLTGTCTPGDNGLARIKALGFTAVWVTPLVRQSEPTVVSTGYHGYWGVDFLHVDPHLGTDSDLVAFSACAKKLKLKLILDIVTNHTADVILYNGTQAYIPNAWAKLKNPSWLNDLSNYHNVGDISHCRGDGDCTTLGDFYGLDDLATEKPVVYNGWADVYGQWIKKYGFSGFRVDTAKHVDTEFFKHWQPLIMQKAKQAGISNFTVFGEVSDANAFNLMLYVRENKIQTVLDFPFQASATDFASGQSNSSSLAEFFSTDDYYTSASSSASNLVTFLGNHDMGRVGFILNTKKILTPSELLSRDELAHALMYFSRGIPTVYYGDEVGMTGTNGGSDQMARQDMFSTKIPDWKTEQRVGSKPIGNGDSFAATASNPIAKYLVSLAALRAANPALANGQMQVRYSKGSLFVISKRDEQTNREYLVAFNNSASAQKAVISTATSQGGWKVLLGNPNLSVRSQMVTLMVPPLSTVVLKANMSIDMTDVKPGKMSVTQDDLTGFFQVEAGVTTNDLAKVAFEVRTAANQAWVPVGVDTNAPYRVYLDPLDFPGQTVEVRATAINSKGKRYELTHATVSIPAP